MSRWILAGLTFIVAARGERIDLSDRSLENPFGGTNGSPVSGWWTFSNTYAAAGNEVDGLTNPDGPKAAYALQINATDGGSLYQTVELDAGLTYTFTVAVGMSGGIPNSDGKFALVFFNQNFSNLVAETSGTITTRGSFADYSVEFTPTTSGIYHAGMRNRGYVPGTGADNNQSRIFFDNVRLMAGGVVKYPAAIDVSSVDIHATQELTVVVENRVSGFHLEIDQLAVTGPDAGHFTLLTPTPLATAPNTDGTINLRFEPLGRSTHIDATLEIHSNDPLAPHVKIPISGLVRIPWQPAPRVRTTPYLPSPIAPGPATGSVIGDTATLSNSVIAATWRETGGVWQFEDATNHLSAESLTPTAPAPLFRLTLSNGTTLTPADMTATAPPVLETMAGNPTALRFTDQLPGRRLGLEFISATAGLRVSWHAELRDGSHFIRPSIEVFSLNAAPITLASVTMIDLEVDGFTLRGSVDGSPAVSGDFFAAHESPMAKATATNGVEVQVGTWNVAGVTPAWSSQETYDVTPWAHLGNLSIRFDYQGGPHRLNIHGVELLEDGIEVDSDIHFGYAGVPSVDNVYVLAVPSYDPSKVYQIRCDLSIDENFSNSSGSITLAGVPSPSHLAFSVAGAQSVTDVAPARHSSVIGAIVPGQERRSFLAYLESIRAHPYRQYLHYNSWLDVSWEVAGSSIMTDSNTLSSMKGHIDHLIAPYNESYDGFVFDDGWDDWNSLWDFDPVTFPNQFTPMDILATTNGTSIGAWLSPFGGYGAARTARIAFGQSQVPPYETNNGGFSLAGPNYYAAFRDRCLQMIADYDFSYFKFDGIGAGNGASGAGEEFFPDIAAMLRLTDELRATRGDLFINLTVGSWPSPFWLESVDSIWRAGADMGLRGAGNNHERWITYRDSETYNNVVGRAPLYPLNSVMVHGITWANNGPANDPQFNSASFKSDLRSYFGSGTNLQELYLSPGKLGPDDWQNLAEGIKWSRENTATLADSHWIGGDPGAGEIYGWAAWRPDKGILTLRNPSSSTATITLKLADAFELPPGTATAYHLKSPWIEDAADAPIVQSATADLSLTLASFEVLTLEATPLAPPAWHADSTYREWALALPSGSRAPNDPFGRSGFTNQFAFTSGLDPIEISGRPVLPLSVMDMGNSIGVEYTVRQDAGTFSLFPQVSTDLIQWHHGPAHFTELERTPLGNGTERIRLRLGDDYLAAPRAFVRWSSSN